MALDMAGDGCVYRRRSGLVVLGDAGVNDAVKMWRDACDAKDKRIAELEAMLEKAFRDGSQRASNPILQKCDELHDLGFNAGWNGAIEECAKIAANNGWEATAAQIRDLSAVASTDSGKS
jgi:hypothetical protein